MTYVMRTCHESKCGRQVFFDGPHREVEPAAVGRRWQLDDNLNRSKNSPGKKRGEGILTEVLPLYEPGPASVPAVRGPLELHKT